MPLKTADERVILLKAGFRGNEIEQLYLCKNNIEVVESSVLIDPWQKHPNGATCAHCQHYQRCSRMINRQGDEDVCDYAPSRFEAKVQEDIVCL